MVPFMVPISRSLKMTTAPPDVCEPNEHVVEYDYDQVRYTDEEDPQQRFLGRKRIYTSTGPG